MDPFTPSSSAPSSTPPFNHVSSQAQFGYRDILTWPVSERQGYWRNLLKDVLIAHEMSTATGAAAQQKAIRAFENCIWNQDGQRQLKLVLQYLETRS